MTFQEYINQPDPVRKPTVYLTMDDLYHHWTVGKQTWVQLFMFGEYYTYLLDHENLFTTDENGNKVSMSCFRLKDYQRNATKRPI